jgi:hypothetical protein
MTKHLLKYDKVRADRTKLITALDFALEYESSQRELNARDMVTSRLKKPVASTDEAGEDKSKNRSRHRDSPSMRRTDRNDTSPAERTSRGNGGIYKAHKPSHRDDDDIPVDPRYKDVECYKCHKKGHLAEAHDRLRKPDAPRMNAMRLVDDRSDEEKLLDEMEAEGLPDNNSDEVSSETTSGDHVEAYKAYANEVTDCETSSSEDEGSVHMRAMKSAPNSIEKEMSFRSSLSRTEKRPAYPPEMRECLAGYVNINGMKAWTLFDLGSDCDAISPAFAQVAKIDTFELTKPVSLELGCKGSKSKITHGATVATSVGSHTADWYFDIANIAHYDAIVGMPFCSRVGLVINVKSRKVMLADGSEIPTSLEGGRTGGGYKFAKYKEKESEKKGHSFRA